VHVVQVNLSYRESGPASLSTTSYSVLSILSFTVSFGIICNIYLILSFHIFFRKTMNTIRF